MGQLQRSSLLSAAWNRNWMLSTRTRIGWLDGWCNGEKERNVCQFVTVWLCSSPDGKSEKETFRWSVELYFFRHIARCNPTTTWSCFWLFEFCFEINFFVERRQLLRQPNKLCPHDKLRSICFLTFKNFARKFSSLLTDDLRKSFVHFLELFLMELLKSSNRIRSRFHPVVDDLFLKRELFKAT